MSVFQKNQSAFPSGILLRNDERAMASVYLMPSHYSPLFTDLLWPRSQGVTGLPFTSDGIYLPDACWHTWPIEESGSGSCLTISGYTKDADGNVLANCLVEAFTAADDVKRGECVSDSTGYFVVPTLVNAQHYLLAYKSGSPDVAGQTVKTLTPV